MYIRINIHIYTYVLIEAKFWNYFLGKCDIAGRPRHWPKNQRNEKRDDIYFYSYNECVSTHQ